MTGTPSLSAFLFLFYLCFPHSSSSSSCSSSSSSVSFSFDAGPHHVDLHPIVDCGAASLPPPLLPHDIILDIHHHSREFASSSSSSSASSHHEWIAGNHFHRLDPSEVVLKARSGPFEASTDVVVDDAASDIHNSSTNDQNLPSDSSSSSILVTAHPVSHALRRDEPVLRALFHATNRRRASCFDHLGQTADCQFEKHICVVGKAVKNDAEETRGWLRRPASVDNDVDDRLRGACVIQAGRGKPTGCLMQIVVPTNWWSSTPARTTRRSGGSRRRALDLEEALQNGKVGRNTDDDKHQDAVDGESAESFVGLHYHAFYVDKEDDCHLGAGEQRTASENSKQNLASDILRLPVTPSEADGTVAASPSNDAVQVRAPFDTVYPGAILHIPVTVANDHNGDDENDVATAAPSDEYIVKAKVKRGLRIIGAEVSREAEAKWRVTVKSRSRSGSSVTIVASGRDQWARGRSKRRGKRRGGSATSSSAGDRLVLATLILKAADDKEFFSDEQVRVAWSIEYGGGRVGKAARNTSQTVLRASRDGVQALVPVIKAKRLLNTALVDGNAVFEPMRVFAVSFTGLVQDISTKASCHSQSRDSLKVSQSCNNVYLDGSETHGFSDVTVLAKYTHYIGYATVSVWVPRLPLQIQLSDYKLSQIRGWKVPKGGDGDNEDDKNKSRQPKIPCSLKFQPSTLRVFARFLTDGAAVSASDEDSDVKWLLGDNLWIDATARVKTDVRVSDPRVASVEKIGGGNQLTVTGKSPGSAMIQVVSPFTGRILASTEIQVVNSDRVDVIGTRVAVLTGLQLHSSPVDPRSHRGQPATLTASLSRYHRFRAVGVKGILDIELLYSDGTAFPLEAIPPEEYALVVSSMSVDVIALSTVAAASSASLSVSEKFSSSENNSHVPTLIATGQGTGDFIYVSLDSPDACVGKRKQASSDPSQSLLAIPTLTSDYVPITVGDGISSDYDLNYSDDWLDGGNDFDGFLNDGSFDGYAAHWALPLGLDPSVRETSQSDGPAGRSYAYQEFSNLGAVKESRTRKKLFAENEGLAIKRENSLSPFVDYDFDRWHSERIRDRENNLYMPGVSEKRAVAPAQGGISKTELALYVLLAVLAIAVAVLAAHCAVHHFKTSRVVKVKLGHAAPLSKHCTSSFTGGSADVDDDDDDSATEDASEDFACADDFVWMSKEALEEAEIPVECTQRLMPDAEFVAQTLQRDLPPHHPGQPAIASLSRGNSRTSYVGSRALTHGGGSSLPLAAHHRGSLPECHHRSRASSVASSGSRMSNRSSTAASSSSTRRKRHSDDGIRGARVGDEFSSLQSSAIRTPVVVDDAAGSLRGSHTADADSLRSTPSRASSLLSVTLNPMDEHHHHHQALAASTSASAFDRDSIDAATMIPSSMASATSAQLPISNAASTSSCSGGGEGSASSPLNKSSISTSMTKRYSPAVSTSPPSSPSRLTGSPPGSPFLSRGSRRLLKQDSVTSTNSKVLGSICYDYRDRGLSFDQMVQYFDHLDETPA